MKWLHLVLLFQALMTFAVGCVFLAEVVSLDFQKVAEYRIDIAPDSLSDGSPQEYVDLKQRFAAASYILLFVSIIEIIIMLRVYIK